MSIDYSDVRRAWPGIKGAQISKTAGIRPYKLDPLYRFVADNMKGEVVGNKIGGLAATTTDGDQATFRTQLGLTIDKFNNNTQATNPLPVANASGLDISSPSQTSARGAEYIMGGLTNPRLGFVIGTDAFFMRVKITMHDVSGTDLWLGFRKNIAFVANNAAWGTTPPAASYLDYALLFADGTATASNVLKTVTTVGGAAATTTTLASTATATDDAAVLYEIRVDLGGNVTYLINGAADASAVAYQFTAGLTVVPMIAFLNTADVADGVFWSQFECGLAVGNVRAG